MYNNIQEEIKKTAEFVNKKLENILPNISQNHPYTQHNNKLLDAMNYMLLGPGKRLRPFLIYASCKVFNLQDSKYWLNIAAAFELLHTYSLIHDDLPCMDNDDERRGKPTCHKKYGEMIAVLAGDALLTYAFELLSADDNNIDKSIKNDLINVLANAAGYKGMVGGQALDSIIKEVKNPSKEQVINVMRMKTGFLFGAACEVGAIIAQKSKSDRNNLKSFGQNIGIAYQIRDDLDDNDDQLNIKASSSLNSYINQATECLISFDKNADTLRRFAKQLQL